MLRIPETHKALVLRTDFSDDGAWESLCAILGQVHHGLFLADCTCLSDPQFAGLPPEELPAHIQQDSAHTFIFLADQRTFAEVEMPLLAVDLFDEEMMTFRVASSSVGCVENNLSLGNSDFADYISSLDNDGVFRFSNSK